MPAKGGKKGRKIDRNRAKCKKYADAGTREKNKSLRISKELRRQARFREYKADIEAGKRPETNTHKRRVVND